MAMQFPKNYSQAAELACSARNGYSKNQGPSDNITFWEHSGDVVWRYHATDIITWKKDGTIFMRPWHSVSTNRRYEECGLPYIGYLHTRYPALKDRVTDNSRWFGRNLPPAGLPAENLLLDPDRVPADIRAFKDQVRMPDVAKVRAFYAKKRLVRKHLGQYLRLRDVDNANVPYFFLKVGDVEALADTVGAALESCDMVDMAKAFGEITDAYAVPYNPVFNSISRLEAMGRAMKDLTWANQLVHDRDYYDYVWIDAVDLPNYIKTGL